MVWRGPVSKIQVTLSEWPSSWHEAQLDQALFEALPRLRERIDVAQRDVELAVAGGVELVGNAERGEERELAHQVAMRLRAGRRRRARLDVARDHGVVLRD